MSGYRNETDERELSLLREIQIGQRVLVRIKRSQFDLEPQKLTGVVKYIGKIDSEYIDNRLYVGVRLDEGGTCVCMYVCVHSIEYRVTLMVEI